MALSHDQTAAINAFIDNKANGERWRRILFEAPAYAMERIALYFYEMHYNSVLTKEDRVQIDNLRDEIDATLEREDLEYLVKFAPEPDKTRYMTMLNGMLQKSSESSNKQLESKPIIIQCPKCNGELELPVHAIGWKVKCSYCNEKFFATEDFIKKQQEPRKRLRTIRIKRPANYMQQPYELSEEEKLMLRSERGEAKAQEPPRSAASPVAAENKKEGGTTMRRNTIATTPQHIGKGTGVDWTKENRVLSAMLAKHGIRKFHVEMANPYCAEVSIPMTEDEDVVRDFANGLLGELGLLKYGDIDFGQFGANCGLDINGDSKCYFVILNQHDVVGLKAGNRNYKYTVEAIMNGDDEEDADSNDGGGDEAAEITQAISFGIKSGAIRSKSGEGYFVLKGEYYDAIEAGRKTTEYRDLTPRNLSLSIGIKTVKFQRGYGHPGQPPKQMRFEVSSVRLMDADDRECDPYAIPPGFIATTIAINLGRRIG